MTLIETLKYEKSGETFVRRGAKVKLPGIIIRYKWDCGVWEFMKDPTQPYILMYQMGNDRSWHKKNLISSMLLYDDYELES
jgi:hypothetical protein